VSDRREALAFGDLAYELQLLLGADEIVSFIETQEPDTFGNIVNYFKDSIYLHSRNLLNAVTAEAHDPSPARDPHTWSAGHLRGRVK
jgi:hypothetical protein